MLANVVGITCPVSEGSWGHISVCKVLYKHSDSYSRRHNSHLHLRGEFASISKKKKKSLIQRDASVT